MSLHVHSMSVSICQFCPIPGKLDKILFYLSMEYFAQFDTTKDFFCRDWRKEEGEKRWRKKPKATFTVEFFFHHFELQSGLLFL